MHGGWDCFPQQGPYTGWRVGRRTGGGVETLLESLLVGSKGRGRVQVALSAFLKTFSGVATSVP